MAPVFQSECFSCKAPLVGFLAHHYCEACVFPQPVPQSRDPYLCFALAPRLVMDRPQETYLKLLRLVHPDRFAKNGVESVSYQNAITQTGWINESIQILSSFSERCEYFFKSFAVSAKKKIPMELAETWFELQDFDFSSHRDDYQNFFEKLTTHQKALHQKMTDLAALLDQRMGDTAQINGADLIPLSELTGEAQYVQSLLAQVKAVMARSA